MLTKRDKEILNWIQEYDILTINQAKSLFFNNVYDNARRRLRVLERQEILNSYISKDSKEKVYYTDKKRSQHDIYIVDFIVKLITLDCNILEFKLKPHYLGGDLIPDAFIKFSKDDDLYLVFLEIDYKHATELLKFKSLYERLYREKDKHEEFLNTFPMIVVSSFKTTVRYISANFYCLYTDFQFSNLKDSLF